MTSAANANWSWERWQEGCERLFAALDLRALGGLYFHDDGEERLAALLPRVLTLGHDWARALLRRVPATGRSLHVGAGIAELPVLLAERFVRGREVVAVNLRARECDLVAAAMRRCGLEGKLVLEPIDAAVAVERRPGYDHLGCVSVFTDPQAFAQLSGVAYGRIAPVQLDLEAFAAERERARALAAKLFAGLAPRGWITTSVDEAAWFMDAARTRGVTLTAEDDTLPTAVVGDPIGFLRRGD